MNTQAVKRWTVNAVSEGQLPLAVFREGRPLLPNAETIADSVSPVHYLLISVATCFALSCRAVLVRGKMGQTSFEVVVIGEKPSASIDNRLSQISVVAVFGSGVSQSDAALITAQAKPLCTVTNTILEAPTIKYNSLAVKGTRPRMHEYPLQQSAH